MSEYSINLDNVSIDDLQSALDGYNSEFVSSFKIQQKGDVVTLTEGDSPTVDIYCSGTLREVAFYWQGFVAGELHGLPDQDNDDNI